LGKKLSNESSTGSGPSHSSLDIFSSENSEQAKDMIMNNIRQEMKRYRTRAVSESGSDDLMLNKSDHSIPVVAKPDKNKQKPTMLLAGPKFRCHTSQSDYDLKRDTIYPVSVCIRNSLMYLYVLISLPLVFFQSSSYYGNQYPHYLVVIFLVFYRLLLLLM